jgi:GTP-binding protein
MVYRSDHYTETLAMQVNTAQFVTSAVKPAQYPAPEYPEVAFAGRSNVGKSSLINTLVNRKRLVKTSSTPGRTQLINFFTVNGCLSFVDLPGYGYAKVPAHIRKQWGPMVETYLSTRPNLKAVVLLMDIRRTPQLEELNFVDWLKQYHLQIVPVLTKCDKLSKTKQSKQRKNAAEALGVAAETFILFSAKTRQGREALWREIQKIERVDHESQSSS